MSATGQIRKTFSRIVEAVWPSRQYPIIYQALPNDAKTDVTEYDRRTILGLARYLYYNIGLVRGAVDIKARLAIGDGLSPRPKTADAKWNDLALEAWNQWAVYPDVTGKFTWGELLRLASIAIDRDGEFFAVLTKSAEGVPQVQLVESHRVGSGKASAEERKDGKFFDGVWVNKQGRPTYYRFLVGEKMADDKSRDLPAQGVIHAYESVRTDEYRGVSNLAQAVNHLRDIMDIIGYEKFATKIRAALALQIERTNESSGPALLGHRVKQTDGPNAPLTVEKLLAGAIVDLEPGAKLSSVLGAKPEAQTMELLKFLIRDVAVGLGLPYEVVWDASALNGTSVRMTLRMLQETITQRQSMMTARICKRVWGYVINSMMNEGKLPQSNEWWKVDWQTPAELSVDLRQQQQDREDLKLGLTTYAELYGKYGQSWMDGLRQKAEEAQYIKSLAEEFGLDRRDIAMLTPNELPADAQVPQNSNPSEDS